MDQGYSHGQVRSQADSQYALLQLKALSVFEVVGKSVLKLVGTGLDCEQSLYSLQCE